jgi:diadenosine tetraphosphate (Ap4A) HIT family hydrolase
MAKIKTLFDKIVDGTIPSWKVWEDDNYLAFLTPFASTPGATVVVPKKNPGDYIFDADPRTVAGLLIAARATSRLLEKAFGVARVALVFEGEAVPHLHAKLYPMHDVAGDRSKFPKPEVFFPVYPGYVMTANGPKMSDEELTAIQQKIQEAAQESAQHEN